LKEGKKAKLPKKRKNLSLPAGKTVKKGLMLIPDICPGVWEFHVWVSWAPFVGVEEFEIALPLNVKTPLEPPPNKLVETAMFTALEPSFDIYVYARVLEFVWSVP